MAQLHPSLLPTAHLQLLPCHTLPLSVLFLPLLSFWCLQVDTEKVSMTTPFLHTSWSALLQVFLNLGLLVYYIGWSALTGFVAAHRHHPHPGTSPTPGLLTLSALSPTPAAEFAMGLSPCTAWGLSASLLVLGSPLAKSSNFHLVLGCGAVVWHAGQAGEPAAGDAAQDSAQHGEAREGECRWKGKTVRGSASPGPSSTAASLWLPESHLHAVLGHAVQQQAGRAATGRCALWCALWCALRCALTVCPRCPLRRGAVSVQVVNEVLQGMRVVEGIRVGGLL